MRVVIAAIAAISCFCAVVANAAVAQQPIESVSVNFDGTGDGGADEYNPNPISTDGRYVAFSSLSTRLVAGDVNGVGDVFVRDRLSGTNVLMSVASDGTQSNGSSFNSGMSGDGRFVAFSSFADNLVADDANGTRDVFLHDRDPDGNGIFDEGNATTIILSRKTNGDPSDSVSDRPAISGDGSTVVFESGEELTPDSGGGQNIFAYDIASGVLTCVSLAFDGGPGGGGSGGASISENGRFVAFESSSSLLVPNDQNGSKDVFVRNRRLGTTQIVSASSDGEQADDDCSDAAISADGTTVVFASRATNLLPSRTHGEANVFARDLASRTTTCVSMKANGKEADGDSSRPAVSGDGTLVTFHTSSTNLVPLDHDGNLDVVLADRSSGLFEVVSADCIGFGGNVRSVMAAITSDGRFVSFLSDATNLNDDGFTGSMIYLRDRTISWPMAAHQNYGDGWPGTLGVPSLTADVDPQYGATVTVDFGNSFGFWTVGFLLVGLSETSLPTSKDGTLLVDILSTVPLAVGPGGVELQTTIPFDESLCGVEIDVQGIEMDPGATKQMAFTPGLQLIIGR